MIRCLTVAKAEDPERWPTEAVSNQPKNVHAEEGRHSRILPQGIMLPLIYQPVRAVGPKS